MPRRRFTFIAAALTSAAMMTIPSASALAGGSSHYGNHGGQSCGCGGTGKKPVTIYKPVTINKDINIYKPVTINKDINIYKPVTINKDINITKNIDDSKNITINKNININKSIVINKGGSDTAEASAFAEAMASASANASANSNVVVYAGGGSYENVTVNNRGGDISAIQATQQCRMQDANVVKAIHAVCVSPDGREFPASHMTGLTWLDSSYEGEVMRCIPGSHLKVVIGEVVQSDQGMAGTTAGGQVLECGEHEALGHYKDGMLKCAPVVPVPDCTERTNLRRYGTGDMFFSYKATVCVSGSQTAARDLELSGMTLDGGVGGN